MVELGASNSVSRESSFSSSGSGILEADVSNPPSRSSSWRSNEDQLITSVTDQQYQRLHNARARFRKARKAPSSESSSTEFLQTPPEIIRPMTNLKRPDIHGRSSSEPKLDLSPVVSRRSPKLSATSPDGLVISAPPAKGFMEYRLRSRSFTGSEHSGEDRPEVKALQDFSRSHLQVPDNGINESCKRSVRKTSRDATEDKTDKVNLNLFVHGSTLDFCGRNFILLQIVSPWSRLSDSKNGAKSRKGARKYDASFTLVFSVRFSHYLGAGYRLVSQ